MQIKERVIKFLLLILLSYLVSTCERFEPEREMKLETISVSDITTNSCRLEGNIIDIDYKGIDQHGFCWYKEPNPTISDYYIKLGTRNTTGSFYSNLSGLKAGTKYYIRAYAFNRYKIFYGNQIEFTTNQ